MKNVLVIYYSQTGQLKEIITNFLSSWTACHMDRIEINTTLGSDYCVFTRCIRQTRPQKQLLNLRNNVDFGSINFRQNPNPKTRYRFSIKSKCQRISI
jgi:hypothetical protein